MIDASEIFWPSVVDGNSNCCCVPLLWRLSLLEEADFADRFLAIIPTFLTDIHFIKCGWLRIPDVNAGR